MIDPTLFEFARVVQMATEQVDKDEETARALQQYAAGKLAAGVLSLEGQPIAPIELVKKMSKLAESWRANVLEMEEDAENWRSREFREMLLGCAQELDEAVKEVINDAPKVILRTECGSGPVNDE